MARINDDAQWIVLMGFLVSLGFFFLAIILNQSVVVGQTTAEGVLEFPKSDIRDYREAVLQLSYANLGNNSLTADPLQKDLKTLSMNRKNAVLNFTVNPSQVASFNYQIELHYADGVSVYNESTYY